MLFLATAIFTGDPVRNRVSTRPLLLIFAVVGLLAYSPANAALPAFPGAEGSGATAVGGRGGFVCEVTNLNDSGPGSLRECIDMEGPRTVIFRVGGTIVLDSELVINNPYITIAGQTAPGDGIQIRASKSGYGSSRLILISTGDVIIRYLRLRPGDVGQRVTTIAANWTGASRVILDHLSLSWSFDGNGFGVWSGPSDVTLQHSIVAENRTNLLSGAGSEIDALNVKNLDYHNNLIANASHRNPMIKSDSIRFVNNIVYNWSSGVSRTSGGVYSDFISNFYSEGPTTVANNRSTGVNEIQFVPWSDQHVPEKRINRDPSAYVVGNRGGRSGMDPDEDNWPYTRQTAGTSDNASTLGVPPDSWRRFEPLPATPIPISIRHADELEAHVLPTVGASQRLDCEGRWEFNRDAADARILGEYERLDGQVPVSGSTEDDFGGFPVLENGTPCVDTSGDGIPDDWAQARGLDHTDPSLGSTVHDSGYTYLEIYMNGTEVLDATPVPPAAVKVE